MLMDFQTEAVSVELLTSVWALDVPSCKQQHSSALSWMLMFHQLGSLSQEARSYLPGDNYKSWKMLMRISLNLIMRNRVFNEIYQERPLCILLSTIPRVQSQVENSVLLNFRKCCCLPHV